MSVINLNFKLQFIQKYVFDKCVSVQHSFIYLSIISVFPTSLSSQLHRDSRYNPCRFHVSSHINPIIFPTSFLPSDFLQTYSNDQVQMLNNIFYLASLAWRFLNKLSKETCSPSVTICFRYGHQISYMNFMVKSYSLNRG